MKRLHLHVYRSEISTQNRFSEYEYCSLEGLMIHTSFKNVSAALGNNLLVYDIALDQTLPDGYYDLPALNKILKSLGNYKLVLADSSQNYKLWLFASSTAWNQEDYTGAVDKTTIFMNASLLNRHIYNMTFFNGIKVRLSCFNEYTTQRNINQITSTQELEFPITAPRGTQQWIYFTPPLMFNADVTNTL